MPRRLIERKLPSAGTMSREELRRAAATVNDAIHDMQRDGAPIQWSQSYITDDAIYCIYLAPDGALAARPNSLLGDQMVTPSPRKPGIKRSLLNNSAFKTKALAV